MPGESPQPIIQPFRLAGTCFLILLILIASFVPGCGNGAHDQAGDAICASEPEEITTKRVQAYNTTVKSLLGGRVCGSCHGATGSSAPYLYLSPSDSQALGIAMTLVNFEDISNSRFVRKILSDHNCGAHDQCVGLSSEVTTAIKSWANEVAALPSYTCESGKRIVLTSVVMNSSDLSLTVDKTLRWDVGAVIPELGKVWFKINAKLVAAPGVNPGAYALSSPYVASSDHKVAIRDMRVLIDSLASVNALNFVDIDFVLDPLSFNPTANWNVPKLSGSTQLVSFQNGQNLGFSFLIEASEKPATAVDNAPRCRVPELFQGIINTVFKGSATNPAEMGYKCFRCHADANNAANTAFPMSGTLDAICIEAQLRSDYSSPSNSLLIRKPDTPLPNHPVQETLSNQQKTDIQNWISAEKAAAGL